MNRKSNIKVSILTATRNCLPYVGQCMRSVLAQTYKNWELLIIDDCSTDQTFKRISEIGKNQSRIKILQNGKRHYCGATYKQLLSMATGDICGVLDGDDVLPADAMSIIVDYYERFQNIEFIWTNHRWYNKDMSKYRRGISGKPRSNNIYDTERKLRHVYSHWRTFRTHLRGKGELFDESLKCAVDKNLGYVLEELGKGGFLNKELYYYRYHPKNMSHGANQRATWQRIRGKHKDKERFESVVLP